MKKSYEDNQALLRQKGAFESMKNYYAANPGARKVTMANYDALKQWRSERTHQGKKERWLAGASVSGITADYHHPLVRILGVISTY